MYIKKVSYVSFQTVSLNDIQNCIFFKNNFMLKLKSVTIFTFKELLKLNLIKDRPIGR